jgi:hypothetical protein
MADYICYACANEGPGRRRKRGSGKVEFALYVVLLVPGPFYSLYRRLGLRRECTHCGMETVVKVSSDQGQIAKRRLDMELGILPVKKKEVVVSVPPIAEPPAAKVVTKKPVNPEEW